jgi:hypothetical protein
LVNGEDYRTPWERGALPAEIEAYELDHLAQSVAYVTRQGWTF